MACEPFTGEQDRKLVELVGVNPCLYQLDHPSHKDVEMKMQTWETIAEEIGKSEKECRWRWRNIKDTYIRRQRKLKNSKRISRAPDKWVLADMLSFLDKSRYTRPNTRRVIRHVVADIKMNHDRSDPDLEDPLLINRSESSVTQDSRTSKLNERMIGLLEERCKEQTRIMENLTSQSQDDIDLFFKSIAISVKKLPPALVFEAKRRTLEIVADLEMQNNDSSFIKINIE